MDYTLIESLVIPGSTRIVFLILDGLSGLPDPVQGTELQAAETPNLDALARRSVSGLLDPIMPPPILLGINMQLAPERSIDLRRKTDPISPPATRALTSTSAYPQVTAE